MIRCLLIHNNDFLADYDMFLKCMDAHHFPTLMDIARSCINEIANTISSDKLVLAEEIGKGDYGTIYKYDYE